VAKLLYQEGHLNEAQETLNIAIRLKKDEPEFYEAFAQISRALGNDGASSRYLAKAKHYSSMKHENRPERIMNHRLIVRKYN